MVAHDGSTARPLVLLSNDDGVTSRGLHAFRDAVATFAEVVICAPETEQSATSHALSLNRPLRLRKLDDGVFALDGTPADCIYVALHAADRVVPRRPALIISGVNRGLNLGQDAFYSGTIAAAREGALRGIPALAASAEVGADLGKVAALAAEIAQKMLATSYPAGSRHLVSLNVPKAWTGEVRATRLGARVYEEIVDFRKDPRGREYLWIGGPGVQHPRGEHTLRTDTNAHDDGAASLTPLLLDLTDNGDAHVEQIASAITRTVATP